MLKITSKDNLRIKELSKLYTSKRARRDSGSFVLEGVRLVRDALFCGVEIVSVFVTEDGIRRLGDTFSALQNKAREVFLIDDSLAARVGDTTTPQGVFAVCRGSLTTRELPEKGESCIILASLQDPGNIGTILRSAAAFGLSVVMSSGCPDPASPKVLRAAMGVREACVVDDVCDAIKALRARGTHVWAAALGEGSRPVCEVSLENSAVVIGNEGSGLPESVIALCDAPVILPIEPDCESLNAAAAATIFAWELAKAKRGQER